MTPTAPTRPAAPEVASDADVERVAIAIHNRRCHWDPVDAKEWRRWPPAKRVLFENDARTAMAVVDAIARDRDASHHPAAAEEVTEADVDRAMQASGPIPVILHCPECKMRHVDAGAFAAKPHHTHSCQGCGFTWRPTVGATVGVQFLPGFKDDPVVPGNVEGECSAPTPEPVGDVVEQVALVPLTDDECDQVVAWYFGGSHRGHHKPKPGSTIGTQEWRIARRAADWQREKIGPAPVATTPTPPEPSAGLVERVAVRERVARAIADADAHIKSAFRRGDYMRHADAAIDEALKLVAEARRERDEARGERDAQMHRNRADWEGLQRDRDEARSERDALRSRPVPEAVEQLLAMFKPRRHRDWLQEQFGTDGLATLVAAESAIVAPVEARPVRSSVWTFALAMEEQLRANDHKGGWRQCEPAWLLRRLRQETQELEDALDHPRATGVIIRESADVANFAMMIADVVGRLSAVEPCAPTEPPERQDPCPVDAWPPAGLENADVALGYWSLGVVSNQLHRDVEDHGRALAWLVRQVDALRAGGGRKE